MDTISRFCKNAVDVSSLCLFWLCLEEGLHRVVVIQMYGRMFCTETKQIPFVTSVELKVHKCGIGEKRQPHPWTCSSPLSSTQFTWPNCSGVNITAISSQCSAETAFTHAFSISATEPRVRGRYEVHGKCTKTRATCTVA